MQACHPAQQNGLNVRNGFGMLFSAAGLGGNIGGALKAVKDLPTPKQLDDLADAIPDSLNRTEHGIQHANCQNPALGDLFPDVPDNAMMHLSRQPVGRLDSDGVTSTYWTNFKDVKELSLDDYKRGVVVGPGAPGSRADALTAAFVLDPNATLPSGLNVFSPRGAANFLGSSVSRCSNGGKRLGSCWRGCGLAGRSVQRPGWRG